MNLLIANSVAVFYGCVYQPITGDLSEPRGMDTGFKTGHLEGRLTPVLSAPVRSSQTHSYFSAASITQRNTATA